MRIIAVYKLALSLSLCADTQTRNIFTTTCNPRHQTECIKFPTSDRFIQNLKIISEDSQLLIAGGFSILKTLNLTFLSNFEANIIENIFWVQAETKEWFRNYETVNLRFRFCLNPECYSFEITGRPECLTF